MARGRGTTIARDRRLWRSALLGALTIASAVPTARAAPPDSSAVVAAAGGAVTEPVLELRGRPHALGRVVTAGPGPTGVFLLSTGGYGYTESVLGAGDAHHRWAGSLTVDGRPLPWLGLALRVDGRYDRHTIPGQPTDTGWVGDPRLFLRVDRALGRTLAVGARAGLWLPGRNVPSLETAALSPELLAAASYTPGVGRLTLAANVGYRLDRSARTATDARLYAPGDRVALDLSAFDSLLVGGAASLWLGPAQAFLEGSFSLLIGSGSPKAAASPLRLGAGVRVPFGARFRLEAGAEVSPSARPDLGDPAAALVPIPPRFAVALGAAYHFGVERRPATLAATSTGAPPGPRPASLPVPAESATPESSPASGEDGVVEKTDAEPPSEDRERPPEGQLRGFVRSFRGSPVEAEIHVDGSATGLRARGGQFQIDIAPGLHEIRISAPGFETQVRQVQVEQNGVTLLNVDLRRSR